MEQDNWSSRENAAGWTPRLVRAVRANQSATDLFDETAAAFLGISRIEARCLDIVERCGRVTAGQLAAESGLSTGAITALVDRLERAGYLNRSRDTADRRRVFIGPTPVMTQFADRLYRGIGPATAPLFERLSEGQLAAIVEFLEVGASINQQRAMLLQDHLPASAATADERLGAAAAFAHAAADLAGSIAERIRNGEPPALSDPFAGDPPTDSVSGRRLPQQRR